MSHDTSDQATASDSDTQPTADRYANLAAAAAAVRVAEADSRNPNARARGTFAAVFPDEIGDDTPAAIRLLYQSGLALAPDSIDALNKAAQRSEFKALTTAQQQLVRALVDFGIVGANGDTEPEQAQRAAIEVVKRIQACFTYSYDGYRTARAAFSDDGPTEGFADNVGPDDLTAGVPTLIDPVTDATQSLWDAVKGGRAGDEAGDESAPTNSGASVTADAITELTAAIRHTVDYVGLKMLPPIEGWSWYDALVKYAPKAAEDFVRQYQQPVAGAWDAVMAKAAQHLDELRDVPARDSAGTKHATAHVHLTADDPWVETRTEISRIADQIGDLVDAIHAGNKVVQVRVDEEKRVDGRLDPTDDHSFATRAQQVNL